MSTSEPRVSPWVKGYVAFHLAAVLIWTLPAPPSGYARGSIELGVRTESVPDFLTSLGTTLSDGMLVFNSRYLKASPVKYYMVPTGFWQYWDMFAPNPASVDLWGDAQVTYADGTVARYRYPRMYELGLGEKYLKERYRKFYERASQDRFRHMWPDFAQRVALLMAKDPNNLPVRVALTRHFQQVPPPGRPMPKEYASYTYYVHAVDQTRLRRDLGGTR